MGPWATYEKLQQGYSKVIRGIYTILPNSRVPQSSPSLLATLLAATSFVAIMVMMSLRWTPLLLRFPCMLEAYTLVKRVEESMELSAGTSPPVVLRLRLNTRGH